jgi:hypothetical protein
MKQFTEAIKLLSTHTSASSGQTSWNICKDD